MRSFSLLLCSVALALPAGAIPNSVGGFISKADSPLNDRELTDILLADAVWAGGEPLPGTWRAEAPVGEVESAFLVARPRVFGVPALLVQATRRDGDLDSLILTFADAGSYFGYFQPDLPEGLSRRERDERVRAALADRQAAFTEFYAETLKSLHGALGARATRRARESQLGKTRTLRTEVTDFRAGDFLLRLIAAEDRLIRVVVSRDDDPPRTWLDTSRADWSARDRERHFAEQLVTNSHGDARIEVDVVPQGYKPYCGLNTLAMAARYFGLHLDEDQLAVAGKFRNTGSAEGSQMPRLYNAVATEAGLDVTKSNQFDASTARSCLRQGLPVIVWRRFSPERDRAHTRQSRQLQAHGPDAPREPSGPDSWPGEDAPLHASIIVGYNDERREFLFRESWSAKLPYRRMAADEMAATAYLTFYFKP